MDPAYLTSSPVGIERTKMKNKTFLFTSILILNLALAACSTKPQGSTQQPPINVYGNTAPTQQVVVSTLPASDSTIMVGMTSSSFTPDVLTIKAGTTVTWTNESSLVHTVTSDTDLFDSGNMSKGASFSYTFNDPGTYTYHCIPHKAYMIGTIVVTD
jgi:plastocyanin